MKYRVLVTNEALRQIEETYRWIANKAPRAATRWFDKLINTIETLETIPQRCPLSPEGQELGIELRQLLYGKRHGVYRMLFVIQGRTVTVLHILHGSREFLTREEIMSLLNDADV